MRERKRERGLTIRNYGHATTVCPGKSGLKETDSLEVRKIEKLRKISKRIMTNFYKLKTMKSNERKEKP